MDQSELKQIANLARIAVNESVLDEVATSITEVLELVDQLKAVDTEGVKPMAHPLDAEQPLRRDEITETNTRDAAQAIAPATEDGLYLVPQVIE